MSSISIAQFFAASRKATMLFLLTALSLMWQTGAARGDVAKTKPNIIVIMADDLGYGDLSCYGATAVKTPNIDKLAAQGILFKSGYCSASTCTPTRYSFLTGTYAFRVPGTGIAPPNGPAIVRPGTTTIASILKQAGYATAVIGKWHLGLGDKQPDWNGDLKPGPLEIGFDHCFLLPTTNDRVPQVYVQDHRVMNLDPKDPLWVGSQKPSADHPTGITHRDTLKMNWDYGHNDSIHNGVPRIGFYTGGTKARFRDEDLTDEWVRRSVVWMEKNKAQPFFLFYASHAIHVPRVVHERFQGATKMGPRGDAIVELDWSVGEIMKAVDRLGIAENTLILFCSDNGPVLNDGYKDDAVEKLGDHKPAGPYRGGKYSVFEGGTRTPFITRWNGRINPGVSDEVVCTIDLPATVAAMLNIKLKESDCVDSMNVLGALLGEKEGKGRDHLLQQNNAGNQLGLRVGQWKLVRARQPGGDGAAGKGKPKNKGNEAGPPAGQLFDLSKDAGEQTNVAAAHPEELKRMNELMDKLIKDGRSRVHVE